MPETLHAPPPPASDHFSDGVERALADPAMQQKLKTQTEQFQRDSPVMSEEERTNLERQIRDGQRDLQRTNDQLVEDFNLRRNEELGKLQREVLTKAQEYARAQKFDLLLADQGFVIFASTGVDVTEALLGALKPAATAPAPAR